ncbi:MAG TPA: hypothetical protein VFI72_09525 [Candidatus Angelobacter sp.]|nr:hypothetical protein [Candidatus Angelobacter sp.]
MQSNETIRAIREELFLVVGRAQLLDDNAETENVHASCRKIRDAALAIDKLLRDLGKEPEPALQIAA